jgi:hypothetical protein
MAADVIWQWRCSLLHYGTSCWVRTRTPPNHTCHNSVSPVPSPTQVMYRQQQHSSRGAALGNLAHAG